MKPKYSSNLMAIASAMLIAVSTGAAATTIPVVGNLDCSGGTACVISGLGGNPLFSGSATSGDVIHITFAGNEYFEPILDDSSLTPWEVSIGGQGTNTSGNVGIGIYLSGISGSAVTGSAGLSLNGFLAGSDGVSFSSIPVFVYDVHIEMRQWFGADVTRDFTLTQVSVVDRPNEGPVITFRVGAQSLPEPGTLAILGFGLAALGFMRRRRAI